MENLINRKTGKIIYVIECHIQDPVNVDDFKDDVNAVFPNNTFNFTLKWSKELPGYIFTIHQFRQTSSIKAPIADIPLSVKGDKFLELFKNPNDDQIELKPFHNNGNYLKVHAQKPKELVNAKTGLHVWCYKWLGYLGCIPDDIITDDGMPCLIEDGNHMGSNHSLVMPKFHQKANKGEYLITPMNKSKIKVIDKESLKKNYHQPKTVKVPNQIFVIYSEAGEYSDTEEIVLSYATSYNQAKDIVKNYKLKYDKAHQSDEDSDMLLDDNLNYPDNISIKAIPSAKTWINSNYNNLMNKDF